MMSVINIVDSRVESEKSEPEATIEMKLDDIKAGHMKTIDSIDVKISSITSNKPSSYYEQPYNNLAKWTLLKSPDSYSHVS